MVDEVVLGARPRAAPPVEAPGWGRELFGHMRAAVSTADTGASVLF